VEKIPLIIRYYVRVFYYFNFIHPHTFNFQLTKQNPQKKLKIKNRKIKRARW
jgi:hypothetical protein